MTPVPADDSASDPWLAIGLDLTLVPTAEGGRSAPVRFDTPLGYRPNWGLPGMTGTGQTGAPVLCCSATVLTPGDNARAVIIPLADAHLVEWRLLGQGDKLRMFEGPTGMRPRNGPVGPRTPIARFPPVIRPGSAPGPDRAMTSHNQPRKATHVS